MLTRILYRIVSVFFLLGCIFCWGVGVLGILVQLNGFHPEWVLICLWAFVLAFLLGDARRDAWRAGRYDPIYRDYL